MYQYDSFDQAMLDARIDEFSDQISRRLSGELTEEQFKPLRLMNGIYLQLHAYMLRIAIPYGTLNAAKLRGLAHVARTYDKGYGHFTTRTNMQMHWLKLEQAPDALRALAKVGLHTIQTSGNCIRNTTADQFAGAAADEVCDPRVWGEVIRQWSTFHPEYSFLPRKFKIAISAAPSDRAAVQWHDVGLYILKNEAGELGFRVMAGGGMGRTPLIAKTVREWLPQQHLLSYLEALLRVYNRYGRRDNAFKARIKILVHEIGIEKFQEEVEAEWQEVLKTFEDIDPREVERIARFFAPPPFETLPETDEAYEAALASDPEFARWVEQNVHAHKAPGYAIATISLKATGETPGDISADQMDAVADIAERYSFDDVRVTHEQNIVLPHVKKADLYTVYQQLKALNLATPNLGLVSDIIACPGLDYCSLANTRAIPVAMDIQKRFADIERQRDIGELKIKISGCINACGHHHAGHIGILGVDRRGEENFQITLGGSGAEDASTGKIIGPGFDYDGVVNAVETIVETYRSIREPGERFLDTYRRVGIQPFKEAVYGQN
ncbi:nitrite/sulfite reductase [Pedomonas mirosovicensis]|uniref:nitrite/sulfite reductase n=1 Tax=Pedomonas mirosovicensis TaxID=2908641 RepID=UPI00216964F7|nr:nitrite/sulfite reductase [Pedomonas mirosovicensis]MCH8684257.1 nitrite/sulfite reductase [Pedomonas mirosovicensis]